MIEVRDYGDKKTLVVYTDEGDIFKRVSNWRGCFGSKAYIQEQPKRGRVATVGYDLYFIKNKQILKKLQTLSRGGLEMVFVGTELSLK